LFLVGFLRLNSSVPTEAVANVSKCSTVYYCTWSALNRSLTGNTQILLAYSGFDEVLRRFISGSLDVDGRRSIAAVCKMLYHASVL